MANPPISGKPHASFIAGNTRATLAEAQNGDWQVSHGALPGLRRWVTSAHLSNKE
ncbi:hypothetical protein RS3R1_35660 [Pseudomonas atacamensis]|uniref:Uncharacterized protein n=1 Tax=Pseudomonas atacamensis TaxID=2565368 RepID=A0ABQ5PLV0_9PSED|nr:hypothetical protein RS3R1_35660 [Pseudomonas atacamensis]